MPEGQGKFLTVSNRTPPAPFCRCTRCGRMARWRSRPVVNGSL